MSLYLVILSQEEKNSYPKVLYSVPQIFSIGTTKEVEKKEEDKIIRKKKTQSCLIKRNR